MRCHPMVSTSSRVARVVSAMYWRNAIVARFDSEVAWIKEDGISDFNALASTSEFSTRQISRRFVNVVQMARIA